MYNEFNQNIFSFVFVLNTYSYLYFAQKTEDEKR